MRSTTDHHVLDLLLKDARKNRAKEVRAAWLHLAAKVAGFTGLCAFFVAAPPTTLCLMTVAIGSEFQSRRLKTQAKESSENWDDVLSESKQPEQRKSTIEDIEMDELNFSKAMESMRKLLAEAQETVKEQSAESPKAEDEAEVWMSPGFSEKIEKLLAENQPEDQPKAWESPALGH